MSNLQEKYKKQIVPVMMEKFGYKNPMAVPKIFKIVVNTGFGKEVVSKSASERKKFIENILTTLSLITGQKPKETKSKKSIASFKLRSGLPIGAKVDLRGKRMYDFLEKVISIVLPRMRDFRGIPKNKIDKQANFTIGFKDFSAFPEVVLEKEKSMFGLEITVVTNAKSQKEGAELLMLFGVPLQK